MKEMLKEFFSSKKALAMIIGLIASFLIVLIPALEPMEDNLIAILGLIAAYILGQAGVDYGKEVKQ